MLGPYTPPSTRTPIPLTETVLRPGPTVSSKVAIPSEPVRIGDAVMAPLSLVTVSRTFATASGTGVGAGLDSSGGSSSPESHARTVPVINVPTSKVPRLRATS